MFVFAAYARPPLYCHSDETRASRHASRWRVLSLLSIEIRSRAKS